METNRREEYVYMDCKIRMTKKAMADLLYAAIITKSGLPTSFGVGIYEYSRAQNVYNGVEVKVHLHPSKIEEFEKHSGVKLREPITIMLNGD